MADREPRTTYFGVWSRSRFQEAKALLDGLGVRFEVIEEELERETLEHWRAWDPNAAEPRLGLNLYIRTADLPALGSKLVEAFPERKFDAA